MRIGILGGGWMGSVHAECYQRIEGAKVVGVFSRDRERAETAAKICDAKALVDPSVLLDDPDIDAIDVCLSLDVFSLRWKNTCSSANHEPRIAGIRRPLQIKRPGNHRRNETISRKTAMAQKRVLLNLSAFAPLRKISAFSWGDESKILGSRSLSVGSS